MKYSTEKPQASASRSITSETTQIAKIPILETSYLAALSLLTIFLGDGS
jgi:hypothetical protein